MKFWTGCPAIGGEKTRASLISFGLDFFFYGFVAPEPVQVGDQMITQKTL